MHVSSTRPDTPCPTCGAFALRLERRLAVLPLSALAAAHPAATTRSWLVCRSCGTEAEERSATQP